MLQKVGQCRLGVTACLQDTWLCKNYVIYFLVIFHKNSFHTSASLLQAVNQTVLPHFVPAHNVSKVHIYFGNHRDDIEKQGKVSFHIDTALCQETWHLILGS